MAIIWYHSEEPGAPTLTNAAGSLINVLDACLIDGFNTKSVTSIVVASSVATATISAHGYEVGKLIEISGQATTALNGLKKVLSRTSNALTFDATGVANGTYTGTVSAKRPGIGWTKLFSATGKAVYQRSDPAATAMVLRVDDTGTSPAAATYARALMVESASDVDTYTNPSPAGLFQPDANGVYWQKGSNSSTPKPWLLVGDGLTFHFFVDGSNYSFASNAALHYTGFGDITSYRAGDAYACAIIGDFNSSESNTAVRLTTLDNVSIDDTAQSFTLARRVDGVYKGNPCRYLGRMNAIIAGADNSGPSFPSPVDNGLVIDTKTLILERNFSFNNDIRGHARGLAVPLGRVGNVLHKQVITGVIGSDREFLCVAIQEQGNRGCFMFDVTGPWS